MIKITVCISSQNFQDWVEDHSSACLLIYVLGLGYQAGILYSAEQVCILWHRRRTHLSALLVAGQCSWNTNNGCIPNSKRHTAYLLWSFSVTERFVRLSRVIWCVGSWGMLMWHLFYKLTHSCAGRTVPCKKVLVFSATGMCSCKHSKYLLAQILLIWKSSKGAVSYSMEWNWRSIPEGFKSLHTTHSSKEGIGDNLHHWTTWIYSTCPFRTFHTFFPPQKKLPRNS